MNVVTACDSGFYHCLKELAKSVRKCYGKPLIVYDIGLTDKQIAELDAVTHKIQIDEDVNHTGKSYLTPQGNYSTRATHKPFCVRHYFENYSEPMIFVDSDCLFIKRVEETGFDVGVTYTPHKKKNIIYYNGMINSGVIFFNTPAVELVERWAKECRKEDTTDQKALSDVLQEKINIEDYKKLQMWDNLKIKIFDTRIYNDFHLTKKGKILHFINTKHREDIYEKLIDGHKKGRDIRKMFREIKRGKKSHIKKITDKITKLFR